MSDDSQPTDLLGDPLRDLPSKRGRRKLKFPPEIYEKVEVLAAGGLSQDDIADATGISAPTLRKYFRQELDAAVTRQTAEALDLLAKAARGGSVPAIKAWLGELKAQRGDREIRRRTSSTTPALRQGKKEQRADAAASVARAGGKYAPPPGPRLAVSNP